MSPYETSLFSLFGVTNNSYFQISLIFYFSFHFLYVIACTVVGLKDRFSHLPSELSGGEQQRVYALYTVIFKFSQNTVFFLSEFLIFCNHFVLLFCSFYFRTIARALANEPELLLLVCSNSFSSMHFQIHSLGQRKVTLGIQHNFYIDYLSERETLEMKLLSHHICCRTNPQAIWTRATR